MTRFQSTRGGAAETSFVEALLQGLAPDGGLYVPEDPGRLEAPGPLSGADFRESAYWAGRRMLAGVDPDALRRIVDRAFTFDAPLRQIGNDLHLLELFHGPTGAFKDFGARFMAAAVDELGPAEGRRTVLVATSGDTGSAVGHAFQGVEGFRVVILFPAEGVSPVQRLQMATLGGNVTAVAVDGTFDACQRMVKEAFGHPGARNGAGLTSANSINVGRLVPQAFYYVHAAARLGWGAWPATFVVPSGNLGNLFGGLLAHRAGMPAAGFVAATNRNRVFPDYLATGRKERRASVATPASAMDVGDPSNLERIEWLYGSDHRAVAGDVTASWADDDEILGAIRDAWERSGTILDPHTAAGYAAVNAVRRPPGPAVLLATAHPGKFGAVVEQAIGVTPDAPPGVEEPVGRARPVRTMEPDTGALLDLLGVER